MERQWPDRSGVRSAAGPDCSIGSAAADCAVVGFGSLQNSEIEGLQKRLVSQAGMDFPAEVVMGAKG